MEIIESEKETLKNTVVNGGYCIGCGACAVVDNSIKIKFDDFGKYQARITDSTSNSTGESVLKVCPFSNSSFNEDQIGKRLYGAKNSKNNELGYIDSTFAGHVTEQGFRTNGSSGGMGTWVLSELLRLGHVDKVVHVKPVGENDNDAIFKYAVSENLEEVMEGSKSRYYPIEISEIMEIIKREPGRYAIVGLPCFIKAVRLLCLEDEIIAERIKFCVGLVCGHLKSKRFASMWSWQLGIHPNEMKTIDFRHKLPDYTANHYAVNVTGKFNTGQNTLVSPPLYKLYGANWGWGYFKYKACDYCDDVVGETADISIGDAWLPQYVQDSMGTNVIVVRNEIIKNIVARAKEEKRLDLDGISPKEVVKSQKSGFSHRREGLAYRLFLADEKKDWRPIKRVEPSDKNMNEKLKMRLKLRIDLAATSHVAFEKALIENKFEVFVNEMEPLVDAYQETYKLSLIRRAINLVKRNLKKLITS